MSHAAASKSKSLKRLPAVLPARFYPFACFVSFRDTWMWIFRVYPPHGLLSSNLSLQPRQNKHRCYPTKPPSSDRARRWLFASYRKCLSYRYLPARNGPKHDSPAAIGLGDGPRQMIWTAAERRWRLETLTERNGHCAGNFCPCRPRLFPFPHVTRTTVRPGERGAHPHRPFVVELPVDLPRRLRTAKGDLRVTVSSAGGRHGRPHRRQRGRPM